VLAWWVCAQRVVYVTEGCRNENFALVEITGFSSKSVTTHSTTGSHSPKCSVWNSFELAPGLLSSSRGRKCPFVQMDKAWRLSLFLKGKGSVWAKCEHFFTGKQTVQESVFHKHTRLPSTEMFSPQENASNLLARKNFSLFKCSCIKYFLSRVTN